MVLFRRRFERLGQEVDLARRRSSISPVFVRRSSPSTPMMSPRSTHLASSQFSSPDLSLADEQLDLAGHVADIDKPQLAFVALQDDPTRRADLRADHFAGTLLRQPVAQVKPMRLASGDPVRRSPGRFPAET